MPPRHSSSVILKLSRRWDPGVIRYLLMVIYQTAECRVLNLVFFLCQRRDLLCPIVLKVLC